MDPVSNALASGFLTMHFTPETIQGENTLFKNQNEFKNVKKSGVAREIRPRERNSQEKKHTQKPIS